jgi:hypothetical protein
MAQREAEKAAAEALHVEEKAAKLRAVIDEFHKPAERSKEQVLALVMQLVARAAERGESEVEVYRFPSIVCSDQGRALTGVYPSTVPDFSNW